MQPSHSKRLILVKCQKSCLAFLIILSYAKFPLQTSDTLFTNLMKFMLQNHTFVCKFNIYQLECLEMFRNATLTPNGFTEPFVFACENTFADSHDRPRSQTLRLTSRSTVRSRTTRAAGTKFISHYPKHPIYHQAEHPIDHQPEH